MNDLIQGLPVAGLGILVVFVGLIALVFICMLLGALNRSNSKKQAEAVAVGTVDSAPVSPAESKEEHAARTAAIAVAIAEDMGCEVEGLRILSIKKIEAK